MTRFEQILEGLKIFQKYGPCTTAAEHDVFYAGPTDREVDDPEDKKKLDEMGWRDEEFGWEIFT